MSLLKKAVLLIFGVLFAAQISNAQSGWIFNKSGGSGDLVTVFFTTSDRGFVAGDDGYLAFTIQRRQKLDEAICGYKRQHQ